MPLQVVNADINNNVDLMYDLHGQNVNDNAQANANEHVNEVDNKESSWRRKRLKRLDSGEWLRVGRLTRVQYKE